MSLLELEHVSKRYRRFERVALDDVSLEIDAGEMVTIWGERRSGRSSLLRLAAGIERPDSGVVRFSGQDLADRSRTLGNGISYCRTSFRAAAGQTVLDLLAAGQFGRGVRRTQARSDAWKALERVAAAQCATLLPEELNGEEAVRVAIARALTSDPRLLVIDEPTIGVGLTGRDRVLDLLRSIADAGVALLTSTGEGTGFLGADRVLSLGRGKLCGETAAELAPVTDIGQRREEAG